MSMLHAIPCGALRARLVVASIVTALAACAARPHAPATNEPLAVASARPSGAPAAPAVRVAVGDDVACSVRDGKVRCWGRGAEGQLGDGQRTSRARPVTVRGISDAVDVTTGAFGHACALHRDGTVSCWGANASGQLGDGTRNARSAPARVAKLENVRQISAGREHTCALLGDATVRCWGRNSMAQLGDGTWDDRLEPTTVAGVRARRIGAGSTRTCAELVDETARGSDRPTACWGGGARAEGKNVAPAIAKELPPGHSLGVSSSFDHACVLAAGQVHCVAGSASSAAIGAVPSVTDAIDLSVGGSGGCAVRADHRATCWDYSRVPAAVPGLDAVEHAAQGNGWGCAVRTSGRVACWGNAGEGRLGDGTVQRVERPSPVNGLAGNVTELAAGSHHTCAVVEGQLRCWGHGRTGALGVAGSSDRAAPVPVTAATAETGDHLVAGQGFTCIAHSSKLRCWGSARQPPASTAARDVAEGVVAAAAHGASLCVVRANGAVACTTSEGLAPPRDVVGMANATAVAVGTRAVCALQRGGDVSCSGLPHEGPTRDRPILVPEKTASVPGIADAVEIALVDVVLVARRKDGAVVSVSLAKEGAPSPPKVAPLAGLVDAVSLAPFGPDRVCVVRAGGNVVCANPLAAHEPPVVFEIGARTIAGGPTHACATSKAGGASCWGDNSYGQIGSGAFGYRAGAADVADE